VRSAEATAGALLAGTDWALTFAVGRDKRLRRRLEKAAAGRAHPTAIMSGPTRSAAVDDTPCRHQQAGGATTQEAIAAHCPMIVNQIVPGQEEGNYELLRRRGIGAYAATPDAVLDALREAFAGQGAIWQSMARPRSCAARLDRRPRHRPPRAQRHGARAMKIRFIFNPVLRQKPPPSLARAGHSRVHRNPKPAGRRSHPDGAAGHATQLAREALAPVANGWWPWAATAP